MIDTEKLFRHNTGFGQLIDDSVKNYPDRIAIVSGLKRLTYKEFGENVYHLCSILQSEGVKAGDSVAVISRNCAEFLIAEFAVLKIGAVVVKINWRLSPAEMQYMFDLNDVHYAFLRYENEEWGHQVLEKNNPNIRFYLMNEDVDGESPFDRMLKNSKGTFVQSDISWDATAFHVHTSGTTGKPKCVVYTHRSIANEIKSCINALEFESDVVYQMVSQFFHSACTGAYMVLASGGTLVIMSRFDPKEYMESLQRERVTNIGVIPVVLKRLLDDPDFDLYDFSSLRVINYSTCPMPPVVLKLAMSKLNCRFYQCYGMTEMGSTISVLNAKAHFEDGGIHLNSQGRPIPGCRIKIIREDNTKCDPNQEGEVLLQGPGRMKEYYKNPELTAEVTADGWYHTRDIGYIDEFDYLHICGRKDDLIISGGENIYPNEIINVIMRLAEDVSEVAVYGVPDSLWGEHVKASVVLLPGSSLTPDKLREYCRANMSHYKVPREIEIIDALPRNATGKIAVKQLINNK